jgi:hypothetical protein
VGKELRFCLEISNFEPLFHKISDFWSPGKDEKNSNSLKTVQNRCKVEN